MIMTATLFPNLSKLASVSLSISVTTASIEHSFSKKETYKTLLRSTPTDTNLSDLMKLAIEIYV